MPKRVSNFPGREDKEENKESDVEFEDDFEDEYEEENLVESEKSDEELETEETKAAYRPGVDALAEDEELVPAAGAYKFLHRLRVDWPCLTFDLLDGPTTNSRSPMEIAVVAGTQAERSHQNKLYLMQWSFEGSPESEEEEPDSEDEDEEQGHMEFRQIPHTEGCVNKVRAMPQMPSIVASWSEIGKVHIWNFADQISSLQGGSTVPRGDSGKPIFSTTQQHHTSEGYGLAWNSLSPGQLLSADLSGSLNLWMPTPGAGGELGSVFSDQRPVMDVAWKLQGQGAGSVFAVGMSDGEVQFCDSRNLSERTSENLHTSDVNCLAWNPLVPELLLTGADDGSFKVWDARKRKNCLAHFHWHKEPVTSLAWHPQDETLLIVASADDTVSLWDMAVEADEDQQGGDQDLPAQLLFLHQGQQQLKETQWVRKYPNVIATTAGDGFNCFRTCNL